jgi:hypothetical protein
MTLATYAFTGFAEAASWPAAGFACQGFKDSVTQW